jgi:hypothetical protein
VIQDSIEQTRKLNRNGLKNINKYLYDLSNLAEIEGHLAFFVARLPGEELPKTRNGY